MTNAAPTISLVIATYNWPEALELCLLSVLCQEKMPDEILIADDGSGPATKELIERFKKISPVHIQHIWHPDEGFNLAQIRNKATVAAMGKYIIQIDGDLILHRCFIKDHWMAAKPGHFIAGSRVILTKQFSEKIFRTKAITVSIFQKGINNRFNGIHSGYWGHVASLFVKTRNTINIRGCNMSFWKNDFLAVNGYNENYTGWGREDTDLVFRFYNSGLQRTYFKLRGIVFHLWHKEADRSGLIKNDSILEETALTKAKRTTKGADQYI